MWLKAHITICNEDNTLEYAYFNDDDDDDEHYSYGRDRIREYSQQIIKHSSSTKFVLEIFSLFCYLAFAGT